MENNYRVACYDCDKISKPHSREESAETHWGRYDHHTAVLGMLR